MAGMAEDGFRILPSILNRAPQKKHTSKLDGHKGARVLFALSEIEGSKSEASVASFDKRLGDRDAVLSVMGPATRSGSLS